MSSITSGSPDEATQPASAAVSSAETGASAGGAPHAARRRNSRRSLLSVAFERRHQDLGRALHDALQIHLGERLLAEAAHHLLVARLLEGLLAAMGRAQIAHEGGGQRAQAHGGAAWSRRTSAVHT
jgi:hypothetical protein